MKPDSIILDIDGTLWNSTEIVANAWNKAISLRPDIPFRFTPQYLTELFGRPLDIIADIAFPFLEKKERYILINNCCDQEHIFLSASNQDLLYPDVFDTIQKLFYNYPLFIVSNCQSGYIELFLKKTKLTPYIKDFECHGNTGVSKGENIKLIMKRNQLISPVYVGDIEGDHRAAMEAAIPFCHASYGFGSANNPDYVIQKFSDLIDLFSI